MAKTASMMLALGAQAPDFSLPNTDGRMVTRAEFQGKPLLLMFICNHCPFVKHVADELAALGKDYQARGVGVVAIMPNNVVTHPDDGPDKMKDEVATRGYTFPYLYDESQGVAKAYKAACTPDFFLFDADHKLAYRGQLDDSRPGDGTPVTGKDLRAALDAVLAGRAPSAEQQPSIGCNIKWKAGNEPDYYGKSAV